MTKAPPIRLGINGQFDEDTIKRMLSHLSFEIEVQVINSLNLIKFNEFDCLLAVNPAIDETKIPELEHSIHSGLTVMILISCEIGITNSLHRLVNHFGFSIVNGSSSSRTRIAYTRSYPKEEKRNRHDIAASHGKKISLEFPYLPGDWSFGRTVLINRSKLFGEAPFAVQTNLEDGIVIFANSFGLPEDRADMLSHLLMNSKRRRIEEIPATIAMFKAVLPSVVESLFEVYEEIPFSVLISRSGLDISIIDENGFYGLLEDVIREGKIAAKIRMNCLIKS